MIIACPVVVVVVVVVIQEVTIAYPVDTVIRIDGINVIGACSFLFYFYCEPIY